MVTLESDKVGIMVSATINNVLAELREQMNAEADSLTRQFVLILDELGESMSDFEFNEEMIKEVGQRMIFFLERIID